MDKIKIYIQKAKNILILYPRLLMIFGILIGVSITCFAGSIFIKNDSSKEAKLAKENNKINNISDNENKLDDKNNDKSNDSIKGDSLNRVVNAIKDTVDDEYNKSESNTNQNNTRSYNNENTINNTSISADDSVLDYFDNTYNVIATSKKDDSNMVDIIKEKLNTISNFLFNGGTINGYTYDELTDEAKLKINKLTLSIDSKINEKFPNYKNKIKQSFKNLKGKVTIAYLDIVDKVCTSDRESLCDEARKDFNKMKETFKITFSLIKDLIKSGKTSLVEYFNN